MTIHTNLCIHLNGYKALQNINKVDRCQLHLCKESSCEGNNGNLNFRLGRIPM